uniref:Uncharacterized protein n=1 Tax=Dendroctonus ponderosae TaxID=77166 RepID=A0AAR5QFV8_DENPD
MCDASASHGAERRRRRRRLSHGVTSLMYAAQQGDADHVRHLVRTQPRRLLDQDRTGKTALHYCCTSDSNRAAQAADLLTMAAPDLMESRDEDGFTPLHLAVIAGNTQLVSFLLANGADVAAVDNEKHTVVHWATVCGETSALRAVLAAGAPASTPDVHGGYPLHYAAQMCGGAKDSELGLQVLNALLAQKEVNVSVEDGDRRQPLLWAASAGSAKALLALVRAGATVESSDRDGLTALHCAASRGHTDCLDTLLTLCGASPDTIDTNGCTALHYAVTLGHADATALLLAHGADLNRQDRKGRSPAHCGCAKGQFETVKLIAARGANLWMRNARGDFPLHDAAASGRRELVSWLLNMRPSQVNAKNNDGRTPLHLAALNDNADMCKILLDSGAAINPVLRTTKNVFMTPLDCALQRGFRSTAKYLQLHGGVPANRLSAHGSEVQILSSSLSLRIRDDVAFWGGSSSESERDTKASKRLHKRKGRKKRPQQSEGKSESEGEVKPKETITVEATPRKSASSRIDYSNEIVINGRTEINIHQTNEIVVDEGGASPRKVAFDSSETITLPSTAGEKERPAKSAKSCNLNKEKSCSDKELATSEDTLDTVIDTYKQKAETLKAEMRQSSMEKITTLQELSNTSEELEGPREMVVEASVHPEPKNIESIKSILKTPELVEEKPPESNIDRVQNEPAASQAETAEAAELVPTEDVAEAEPVAAPPEETAAPAAASQEETAATTAAPPAAEPAEEVEQATIASLTTAAVVKKPAKEAESPQAPALDLPAPNLPELDAQEQPAIIKILSDNERQKSEDSSEILSDSMEQASKVHKSFKVLSMQEAKQLPLHSKSEDLKQKKPRMRRSHIPTATFHTPLSKSDRQLDRLVEREQLQIGADCRVPSLPNIHQSHRPNLRPDSNLSAPIMPLAYSENEAESGSDLEEDARLSPSKKKKVKKRPKAKRRESRSAGSDYESSNLIDSGFEPSPRSSRIPKWKNVSDRGVNMSSVTRSIQNNIRRYHLERKIFQHLLDLKRSQIRAGQHNETVLVKRAIDQYNQSCASTVGAGRYIPEDFSFKSFEKFLYESLRKLQKLDMAHLKGLPDSSEHVNPLLCTQSTHRCMHATHAYTGVPCAAYLPKMDHHSIPKIGFSNSTNCKPGTAGFLPSINPKKAVMLELSHGTDKQVISLPTDKLDQNKRYYVTFTVKGQDAASSEENAAGNGHIHSKSD